MFKPKTINTHERSAPKPTVAAPPKAEFTAVKLAARGAASAKSTTTVRAPPPLPLPPPPPPPPPPPIADPWDEFATDESDPEDDVQQNDSLRYEEEERESLVSARDTEQEEEEEEKEQEEHAYTRAAEEQQLAVVTRLAEQLRRQNEEIKRQYTLLLQKQKLAEQASQELVTQNAELQEAKRAALEELLSLRDQVDQKHDVDAPQAGTISLRRAGDKKEISTSRDVTSLADFNPKKIANDALCELVINLPAMNPRGPFLLPTWSATTLHSVQVEKVTIVMDGPPSTNDYPSTDALRKCRAWQWTIGYGMPRFAAFPFPDAGGDGERKFTAQTGSILFKPDHSNDLLAAVTRCSEISIMTSAEVGEFLHQLRQQFGQSRPRRGLPRSLKSLEFISTNASAWFLATFNPSADRTLELMVLSHPAVNETCAIDNGGAIALQHLTSAMTTSSALHGFISSVPNSTLVLNSSHDFFFFGRTRETKLAAMTAKTFHLLAVPIASAILLASRSRRGADSRLELVASMFTGPMLSQHRDAIVSLLQGLPVNRPARVASALSAPMRPLSVRRLDRTVASRTVEEEAKVLTDSMFGSALAASSNQPKQATEEEATILLEDHVVLDTDFVGAWTDASRAILWAALHGVDIVKECVLMTASTSKRQRTRIGTWIEKQLAQCGRDAQIKVSIRVQLASEDFEDRISFNSNALPNSLSLVLSSFVH